MLAQPHRRRLDRGDAAGADQDVGLQAELRHAEQAQAACPAADELAHHRHGAAGIVRGQRQQGPVGDQRRQICGAMQQLGHVRSLAPA